MLTNLLLLLASAAILGRIKYQRSFVLMIASTLFLYFLQPKTDTHNFSFWVPTIMLFIIVITWFLTVSPDKRNLKQNWLSAFILFITVFVIISTRYFSFFQSLEIYPPRPIVFLLTLFVLFFALFLISKTKKLTYIWQSGLLMLILFIFILTRIPALLEFLSVWVVTLLNRGAVLSLPIQLFGFSYIAFRLIHTIRDRQSNRLLSVGLDEYINYIIFFPSLGAGPIDRIERFIPELRHPKKVDNDEWINVSKRIFWGLFKKFIIADSLAIIAINAGLVQNVQSQIWMWVTVYAYSFQIYFDFSGYTDIAIGTGRLLGVHLPENFRNPYLKSNIALFWNNWHITLTQWFRAYYFNPLTRFLRRKNVESWVVLVIVQLSTMILIGLWHGMTTNFILWGLWHGIGLFIHNRWHHLARQYININALSSLQEKLLTGTGIFLTFNFVALGWVFFALPTPTLAKEALFILLGFA